MARLERYQFLWDILLVQQSGFVVGDFGGRCWNRRSKTSASIKMMQSRRPKTSVGIKRWATAVAGFMVWRATLVAVFWRATLVAGILEGDAGRSDEQPHGAVRRYCRLC